MRVVAVPFAGLDARTAYDVWRLRQAVFVVEQECPYPDLDAFNGALASMETKAHLELLVARGQATRAESDGVVVFTPVG